MLERELGHGGMATVYLAQDVKHRRRVAVKVLRSELAANVGSSRFVREIEILAQLQHPHILPLLDSGETEGFLYYVMPYVDGESLRERLTRTGEFPISDAVRILAEVAEALAYAHGRGVMHRDLKPENIMISGRHPLVMDFGIAKAVSPEGATGEVTTEGIALGTPRYMAPEQAVGEVHLDHRVDIYALGVIGYELLTGTAPFRGKSPQQILAAKMTERPTPIAIHRPTVPAGLEEVIMRCLEKRPADRPQGADEILHALETMVTPAEGSTPAWARGVPGWGQAMSRRSLLVGAGIIAILAGLLWRLDTPTSRSAVARHTQLTFVGTVEHHDISPDAQFLAYIERGETTRLLVRDLTSGSSVRIATVGDIVYTLRWSPSGSSILYVGSDSTERWGRLLFPRLGGAPRQLPGGGYGIFSRDGSRFAGWNADIGSPIYLGTVASNKQDSIGLPESAGVHDAGDWSPDGRLIALQTGASTGDRWMLWAANVETGQTRQILLDTVPLSPPRWSAGGEALYYIRNNDELCRIRIARDGSLVGMTEVLQTGLGASQFSISADGTRLVYLRGQRRSNLWLASKSRLDSAFVTVQVTRGTSLIGAPGTSPDGRLVAFVRVEQGIGDVFVVPIGGGVPRQVTTSGAATVPGVDYGRPGWSPDGRHLAYIGEEQGVTRVRTVPIDGGRERIYERTEVGEGFDLAWAPAHRILYQRPGNRNFHWLDTTNGAETPLVTNDHVGWMFRPLISPTGQEVAVSWNRMPRQMQTYIISLQDSLQTPVGPQEEESIPLGWSRDGSSLYVDERPSGRIHRISIRNGRSVFIGANPFKRPPGDLGSCELNEKPAGIALVCSVDESVSDVWMMENFDPAHQTSR